MKTTNVHYTGHQDILMLLGPGVQYIGHKYLTINIILCVRANYQK